MLIRDLGEFGVIDLLNRMVVRERAHIEPEGARSEVELLVDTGDDAAAWSAGGATELFTTDTVVDEIHFTRETTPWRDLGWKSLASNISDIAAMGGLPTHALVTLGLPPETVAADLEDLYRGMLEICNKFGVSIVGGDMVRSPVVFITVALSGVTVSKPLLRSTARPGDVVAVTGWLGNSAGGLKLMLEGLSASHEAEEHLKTSHRRPAPQVAAGRVLSESGVATAMDVSDGLCDDLGKLCRASGVAAEIEAPLVPIHPLLREVFPGECLGMALNGGEDYKLLFTGTAAHVNEVNRRLPEPAVAVGRITAGESGRVTVLDGSGAEVSSGRRGWDHFAS